MGDSSDIAIDYQRRLFAVLDEFFVRCTGQHAPEFSSVDQFVDTIKTPACAARIAPRGRAAFEWVAVELDNLYRNDAPNAFIAAKQLGGLKLVLGGNTRFNESQLASTTTSVLHTDTIFVPDPIMPWFEADRWEEKFPIINILQAAHTLLHLKPLIDADLQYPPVVVFSTKQRVTLDDHRIDKAFGLVAQVFSHTLGHSLPTAEDVRDFAHSKPEEFLSKIDREHLFVAPGGGIEPIDTALRRYDEHVRIWRTPDWLNREYYPLPTHLKVLSAIIERILPFAPLFENAEAFGSHPMVCLEQQAHYLKAISKANTALLQEKNLIDPRTTALVEALGSRRLQWLSDLPVELLVLLRHENANVEFRRRLTAATSRLHESSLFEVDKVASEVCHEISSAVQEHEKRRKEIQEKYRRKHEQTAVTLVAAAAGLLIPVLAPFAPAASIPLAAKYLLDKHEEHMEKKALSRSLFGILAAAKE